VGDVYDVQAKRFRRCDYLYGLAFFDVERRSQSFVTPNDLAESSFQRDGIKRSLQQDGVQKVVRRTARLELIEEPESPLCERQRSRSGFFTASNSFATAIVDSMFAQQRFQQGSPFV
jgi:hypothetical protein